MPVTTEVYQISYFNDFHYCQDGSITLQIITAFVDKNGTILQENIPYSEIISAEAAAKIYSEKADGNLSIYENVKQAVYKELINSGKLSGSIK